MPRLLLLCAIFCVLPRRSFPATLPATTPVTVTTMQTTSGPPTVSTQRSTFNFDKTTFKTHEVSATNFRPSSSERSTQRPSGTSPEVTLPQGPELPSTVGFTLRTPVDASDPPIVLPRFPSGGYFCPFSEAGFCSGLSNDPTANTFWTVLHTSVSAGGRLPSTDHTSDTGFFAYVDPVGVSPGDRAVLLGPVLPHTGGLCVTFWVYMSGSDVGSLYVVEQSLRGEALLWEQNGPLSDEWEKQTLSVSDSGLRIAFIYIKGGSSTSDVDAGVALDDLRIMLGQCEIPETQPPPSPSSATTTASITTTKTTTTSTTPTTPTTSTTTTTTSTTTTSTTPTSTTSTSTTTTPGSTTGAELLITCTFEAVSLCPGLSLGFGSMNWTRNSGSTKSGNTGPDRDHTTGSGYYLYLEASERFPGDTAVLRVAVSSAEACVRFVYHMYGLHIGQLQINRVEENGTRTTVWRRNKDEGMGSRSWQTAEVSVLRVRGYLEVTAVRGGGSRGQPFGDIAIDDLHVSRGGCTGGTSGGNSSSPTGQTTTATTTSQARTTTQTTTAAAPTTTRTTTRTTPTTTTRATTRTTTRADDTTTTQRRDTTTKTAGAELLITCAFEDTTLCPGLSLGSGSMNWTRHSGSTKSSNTGPDRDHTTGSGSYLYLEATGQQPGDEARLQLTLPPGHSSVCVAFFYHMFGHHLGRLRLDQLTPSGARQEVWSRGKQGDQGLREWQEARVDVVLDSNLLELIAVRGGLSSSQPFGDIAVDDVMVFTGSCDGSQAMTTSTTSGQVTSTTRSTGTSSTTTSTSTTTSAPSTTTTLPTTTTSTTTAQPTTSTTTTPSSNPNSGNVLVSCSFDVNECGMVQSAADSAQWTRLKGRTPSTFTGPNGDHSTNGGSGYFMYLEATGLQPGSLAVLRMPTRALPAGVTRVCVEFWYSMYGQHTGSLKVMSGSTVAWSKEKEQSEFSEWIRALITVNAATNTLDVRFEATKGGRQQGEPFGDIAIDDVTVTAGPCLS